jgi:hypothetical protein
VQGGIFLRKMPLEGSGFGVQQSWNRYNHDRIGNGCSGRTPERRRYELPNLWRTGTSFCGWAQRVHRGSFLSMFPGQFKPIG